MNCYKCGTTMREKDGKAFCTTKGCGVWEWLDDW